MNRETPKLLVVAGTTMTSELARYALKVAVRLDLEIIVLFIVDKQLKKEDIHEYQQARAKFEKMIEKEMAEFSALAWRSAVKVTTVVDEDDRELAISKIKQQEPEIRIVLSATSRKQLNEDFGNGHPRLTVIRRE